MKLTNQPFYYQPLIQINDNNLYHYTKAESFFKILEDLTLRPSQFGSHLNDLNEGNQENLYGIRDPHIRFKTEKAIQETCSILCFSKDYSIEGNEYFGYNHPAMWAHYANNCEGACIVINKQKFIKENDDILNNIFYKFEDIEYCFSNTIDLSQIDRSSQDTENFIKNNYKSLFFRKHIDWQNETEHRLFMMNQKQNLSIKNCIEYIVLGKKFCHNEKLMDKLLESTIGNVTKFNFTPELFKFCDYGERGYFIDDFRSSFLDAIQMKIYRCKKYKQYLDWYSNIK